ncbi:MAG: hypothetical protein U0Q16_36450 [Bryobacteraceae bacterium]
MAALCIAAYGRAIALPFISDDYIQIRLAREYGPVSGWWQLAGDALYRCRATSLVLTYWTEQLFGLNAFAFNASSLALHVINTWLVFALGGWKRIGWRVSTAAACYFAVYQGHQEAVIWYAALPELLVFGFSMMSVLCWMHWLESRRVSIYAAALGLYVLALLSKESAVCVVPLIVLLAVLERQGKRAAPYMVPFVVLAALYFLMAHAARASHLHFNDGTFSLTAPFWITTPRSVARMLWISGGLSLVAMLALRARRWLVVAGMALVWMAVTLLPYSFLTYQPFVPSRHTYLASAGLALLAGAGFGLLRERVQSRAVVALVALTVITTHWAYLWTRKHNQFELRAEPTERLLEFAEGREGPIHVKCFPYSPEVANSALEVRLGPNAPKLHFNGQPELESLDLCDVRF